MAKQISFPKDKIKILLLEGVHSAGQTEFREAGYEVRMLAQALPEQELIEAIAGVHIIGIRSKTQITRAVLEAARHLMAVGCFCIGTNQVDLASAASFGVPVFNAPFSNTRSVAELTMAEIVMLARRAAHKNNQLHRGEWDKSAAGCYEVRNKVLGVVGYGHIGPQVGALAEAFGMRVLFYDIAKKLALGTSQSVPSLKALLEQSDFVTLHVPETPQTLNMISAEQLAWMKKGSYLLNLSRGTVVDIPDLKAALVSKHLAGAAVDVFPQEPDSNKQPFGSELCGLDNVILTPHIGGSTLEAQRNIAIEVVTALVRYSDSGSSAGAVNFPEIDLPLQKDSHRLLNIHRNVPGVLRDITKIVAEVGANIRAQYLGTHEDVGYLIMDIDQSVSGTLKNEIEGLSTSIKTRVLY